jgi:excinuclease ABC subunit A
LSKKEKEELAISKLESVGLSSRILSLYPSELSGGMQKRVSLTRAICSNPEIIFFDEPTTGLHFHDIKKLLASFNALIEQGHSIIIIEHNTDVIKSADWVICRVLDRGSLKDWFQIKENYGIDKITEIFHRTQLHGF